MKTSRILCSMLLASALAGPTAHAADPQPAAADIQALMVLLNKIVAQSAAAAEAETAAADEPAPAPAPPPAAPAPNARQPLSTALKTGSLSAGSLTPSAGLGGRGAATVARLTEEAWRALFPARQPGN